MAVGVLESAGFADVFELSAAEVVVEDVRRALEAAGAAHDGNSLPDACRGLAGRGRVGEVEVHVVGDGEIEFSVAVIIDEGAAGAPFFAGSGDACLLGYLFEGAIALVVEEAVFAVAGDVEVVESVVVIVADADALAPAGGDEAGLGGDVGEGAVVVVVEEVAGGLVLFVPGVCAWEGGAVDEEDVRPAVAVVVEDGDAGAGGLDDVTFGLDAAVNVANGDASLRRDIDEPCRGRVIGRGRVGLLGEGDRRKENDRARKNVGLPLHGFDAG